MYECTLLFVIIADQPSAKKSKNSYSTWEKQALKGKF